MQDYRPSTISSQFNDAHICIYPLRSRGSHQGQLYRVQIHTKASKVPPFGPLHDGALVSEALLAPLVRQTAINANRARRYATQGYGRPYPTRQKYLNEIIERHSAPLPAHLLLSSLFSQGQPAAVTAPTQPQPHPSAQSSPISQSSPSAPSAPPAPPSPPASASPLASPAASPVAPHGPVPAAALPAPSAPPDASAVGLPFSLHFLPLSHPYGLQSFPLTTSAAPADSLVSATATGPDGSRGTSASLADPPAVDASEMP